MKYILATCAFIFYTACSDNKTPTDYSNIQVSDYRWYTGGFDTVLLMDGTITNKSEYPVKDLLFSCVHYAKSGSPIDHSNKTLYLLVEVGETLSFTEFNMGFLHPQVSDTACKITSATYIK